MRNGYRQVDLPTSGGDTVTIELTAAASKLLRDLEARDYLLDSRGPCWLVDRPSATRYALVVPVDYSEHGERLRAIDAASIDELERRGLAVVDWTGRIPELRYGYRDKSDRRAARPVALTELGRQRLHRTAQPQSGARP